MSFVKSFGSAGLLIESINASTVLSYSALKVAQPDIDEDVLLINMALVHLLYFSKMMKVTLFGTINYGGNTLTQFISDTLGKAFQSLMKSNTDFLQKKVV